MAALSFSELKLPAASGGPARHFLGGESSICREKTFRFARLPRGKPRGMRSLTDSRMTKNRISNGLEISDIGLNGF